LVLVFIAICINCLAIRCRGPSRSCGSCIYYDLRSVEVILDTTLYDKVCQ
jgi:hypothetical protein